MNQEQKPSDALIQCAKSVFLAQAWEGTVRPVVEAIQNKHLQNGQYKNIHDHKVGAPEIITKNRHTYLMSDEDYNEYYELCYKDYLNEGFKELKHGTCPLLIAENLTREAVRAMLIEAKKITKLDPDDVLCSRNGLENYKKLTDLTLSLCAPYVDSKELLKSIEPKKQALKNANNTETGKG